MATNTKKCPTSQSFHQLSKLTQMNILNKLSQTPHQKRTLQLILEIINQSDPVRCK